MKGKISESLERFTVQSGGSLLALPAQIGVSSFKDLLAGSIQDSATQERVASLYYKQRENLEGFWEELRQVVGPEAADRLQLDGKLGFLTVNNAPLIKRLHQRNRNLRTPLDLVRNGFYRSDAWEELLGEDGIIPNEIPGETPKKRKANYAAFLADQLRLSYPTAVVAEMVRADTIPLRAEQKVKTAVTQFLMKHQGTFELGIHPVEHYLLKNDIAIDSAALAQLKTLQRVYQISPSDETMAKLLAHRIDSAQAVVRYDEQVFVGTFKEELGGESVARLVYAKAQQVHHTVLNIYTTYLLEKSSPALYAFQSLPGMNGSASMNVAAADGDEAGVIAMPTLERIFGEMDYCACDHCRSWLSPAAYLVDLLLFLNREPDEWTSFLRSWRAGHDEAPYPFLNQENGQHSRRNGRRAIRDRCCRTPKSYRWRFSWGGVPIFSICSSPARTPIPYCRTSIWSTRSWNTLLFMARWRRSPGTI